MAPYQQVTIVGVGLIGGSIGLAIKAQGLAKRVVGVVRKAERIEPALACGVVDSATTDLAEAVKEADLIVVCTPVATIAATVREASQHCSAETLLLDAGSTKASIASDLGDLQSPAFVGCHPLAGHHATGPEAATAALFDGKTVVVTPTDATLQHTVERATAFWRALGAQVLSMTPEEHDRAVAATSHVPHAVASILAAATPEALLPMVSSGWLDTTRVAAGSPRLWRQIVLDNRAEAEAALDAFEQKLKTFRAALQAENGDQLEAIFREGKERRDAVGN